MLIVEAEKTLKTTPIIRQTCLALASFSLAIQRSSASTGAKMKKGISAKQNNLIIKPGTTIANKTGTWRTFYPVVDHEICIGCGTCDRVCPEGVCFPTGQKNSKGFTFYDRDLDYCKGCGLCAKECPVKAITMHFEEK